MKTVKRHIFLSYVREDRERVRQLRLRLIEAGETVWWDGDDILPGADWKTEVRRALRESYAVLACFSEHSEARYRTGIFPEIDLAIEEYGNLRPGSIYLIPVRFADCEIPDLELTARRTLRDLQTVDLFPDPWPEATLDRLLSAIRRIPDRP